MQRCDCGSTCAVVGQVKQAGDEESVDCFPFGRKDFTRRIFWHHLADKTALCTDWHDHGIFYHLRLDQAEHFGAVVFHPV